MIWIFFWSSTCFHPFLGGWIKSTVEGCWLTNHLQGKKKVSFWIHSDFVDQCQSFTATMSWCFTSWICCDSCVFTLSWRHHVFVSAGVICDMHTLEFSYFIWNSTSFWKFLGYVICPSMFFCSIMSSYVIGRYYNEKVLWVFEKPPSSTPSSDQHAQLHLACQSD